jgi:hypothetical protein
MRTTAKDPGEGRGRLMKRADGSRTRSFLKAWIVRLALWGWLPFGLATWLIQRGGLRHD